MLTEADLIRLMDKNKIGTDASIPVHIIHSLNRGYARISNTNEHRELIPTQVGLSFIESLANIDKSYTLPEMRASIEAMVKDIADGNKKYQDVLRSSLIVFYKHYCTIESRVTEIAHSLRAVNWTSITKQTSQYQRRRRRGRRGNRGVTSE